MKKIFAATLISFSLVNFLCAKSISLDEAVSFALEHNVSVERNEITLSSLERSKNHSWNSASPSISVGAGATIPTTGESNYDYTYNVNASVSVSLSANLYTQIRAAKINYELGKITFDEALRAVELSVRQSFYALLYERENIALQESNLSLAKSQYNTNLAKYNQGRLSELDVLSAEVNYKSAEPTLENAKANYQNDLDSFKQLLGLSLDEDLELSGELSDAAPLSEISVSDSEISSPEILTLEKKIESAKNSVLDKRFSAYSPTITARWQWQDVWTKPDSNGENPKQSSSLSLSATIPLDGVLPWSQKNDAIDSAKDSLRDLELQLSDAKLTLSRNVASSLRTIKQGQAAVRSKEANVRLARRSYTMTQEAYNRGTKDLLSLQNAQGSLLSAQQSLRSEQFSLAKSILALENTLALPFGSLSSSD